MYTNTSEEFGQLVISNGRTWKARITVGEDVVEDILSIEVNRGSATGDSIEIGTAVAGYVEIIANSTLIFEDKEIILEEGLVLSDGTTEYISIGKFDVTKAVSKGERVTISAADILATKAESIYVTALTDTAEMVQEICAYLGISFEGELEGITIASPTGLTKREALGYIAGLYGKFACINRQGNLVFKWYEDTYLISRDDVSEPDLLQNDFTVNKLVVNNGNTEFTAGTSSSTGIFSSNPLMTEDLIEGAYSGLAGFKYRPGIINLILGDPRLDPWDMISYENYILICGKITDVYDGGIKTVINSPGKSESESESNYKGPTAKALERYYAELVLVNEALIKKLDVEQLDAVKADIESAVIKELGTEFLTVTAANVKYADIKLANINIADIGTFFASCGLIDRATIVEGHVTGYLDSVEVNANKITAGTLIADRILLSGNNKGVLYALNNLGELTSESVDTLDGYVITERTINADKIVANSITASELNVTNIFGNTAVLNAIVSQDIFSAAIAAHTIVVGAYEYAEKALKEVNGTVKSITMHYLATSASSGVTTSTSGWTTTTQNITSTNKYLWTYQTITFVDETSTNTTPVISGVYGNTGTKGDPGEKGTGISKLIPLYYLKSNTTAPSAPTSAVTSTSTGSGVWTIAIPTYVSGYTYFTCTQTLYSDGSYGWSTVMADNAFTKANSVANAANTNAVNAVSTANTANTTANSIKNNIYKSGTTLIDGEKIYTGSITAEQIDVGDLFSKDITASGIIRGVELIGGDILSTNFKLNESGMYIDLENGELWTRNIIISEDLVTIVTNNGSLFYDDEGLQVQDKLIVRDDTILKSNLDVTGETSLGGALSVASNAIIWKNLDVYSATTLGSKLNVTGATTLSSTLDVTGNATIGASATRINIGKAGTGTNATSITFNNSIWINPYDNIVILKNNCGLYGVKKGTTNGYVHLIGLNANNQTLIAGDSSDVRIGKSPQILSLTGTMQLGASGDGYVTYLTGSEVWVCNTAKTAYKVIKASAFTVSSTKKLKENVLPMTTEESRKIYDLDVVSFDYINGEKNQHGLIAEDVVDVIPSIVYGDVNATDPEGIMKITLNYVGLIPYILKEMQIHENKINKLMNL